MDAKQILEQPYARKLTPSEGGGYVATIQEFPGCIADGDTPVEALNNLESAAESWIEASLGQGREIPEPIDNQGFSGKIALRIPRGLHKQAAEWALSDGTSVNQLLTAAIANYFGGKQAFKQLSCNFTQNNITLNLHLNFQQRAQTLGNPRAYFRIPQFVRPQYIVENRDHG